MKLLCFRGGPRDGQVLKYAAADLPEAIMEALPEYRIRFSGKQDAYYADYEQHLMLPKEATMPARGDSS